MRPVEASSERETARADLEELQVETGGAAGAGAPFLRVWVRPLLIFFLAALVLYTLLFTYHAAHLAFSTGELNYAESTWLFAAIRVRHGLTPYFDYSHPPYIPMAYPPLEPGLAGLLGMLLSASDSQVIVLARLLTLAAALAVAGGIFVICRASGAGPLPSLVAALLFFTPYHTFALWSFVARADMLAVALGVWAVALLMLRPAGWGLVAAGVLAGLSLAAKQTAVAPLLAGGWWLMFPGTPERRRGLLLLLGGCLGALALVLAPLGVEGIRLLVRGTLDLVSQPWTAGPFYVRLRDVVSLVGPLFPVALLGLTRSATPPALRGVVVRYLVVALLVLLLTSGKLGSASSYALELIAVLAVVTGLGIQWLVELRPLPREVLAGALILVMTPLAVQIGDAMNVAQSFRDAGADDRPLLALADPGRGPVLSEDGYILLQGADPPFLIDPFFFSALASAGRWDPEPLRRMAAERGFSAVVLTRPIETPLTVQGVPWIPEGVHQEIANNYVFKAIEGRYYVYVPRP